MARRKRKPKAEDLLGSLEAKIMADVWRHGESSVGDVLERLNANQRKQLAYNTVMSVMARLAEKGLLERHREGRAYHYRPAVTKKDFVRHQAAQRADELLDEFGGAAVAGFVDRVREDDAMLAELRELLGDR